MGPPFTGHFRVTADTPRGLVPLSPAVSLPDTRTAPVIKTEPPKLSATPLIASKNIYKDAPKPEEAVPKTRSKCATCGVDCSLVRYHCTKNPALDICPVCYKDGRFSTSLYSGDFIRLNEGEKRHNDVATWTEQETLLLLEGLELYQEDWSKIAQHVGTRTRDQCLLQFLQLPIEDTFVGEPVHKLGALQYSKVPFSPADNPVLTLTSFLASVVNPKVASAAAEAAVGQLKKSKAEGAQNLDKAAATAIGAAAAKSFALAELEEKEMQKITRVLIETQLQKMELKLQHFQELEALLEKEVSEVERERQKLYAERLSLKKTGASPSKVVPVKDVMMEKLEDANLLLLQ